MRFSELLSVAAITLVVSSCSRGPLVTVRNQSGSTLSNMVVSGSGFSERVGSIPAGGEHRLRVHPRGETGVRLEFDVGARHVDTGSQGYFEASGGYRITATVGTNLEVSVTSELGKYRSGPGSTHE